MAWSQENSGIGAKTAGVIIGKVTSVPNEKVAAKKSLCILFYTMAKGSFRMMGRILGINHTLVSRRVRSFGESLPKSGVSGEITQMEFDEMRHFVGSKKTNFGSSKPLTVAHGELWPGCLAVVIL
jgi:hypothetical protein